jgi:hypothetical protein
MRKFSAFGFFHLSFSRTKVKLRNNFCEKDFLMLLYNKTFYDLHNFFTLRGKRIHFERLGVASKPSPGYDTLANLMAKNGHQHITYLKV